MFIESWKSSSNSVIEYLMKLEFPFPFVEISAFHSYIFERDDPIETNNDKKYYRIMQIL